MDVYVSRDGSTLYVGEWGNNRVQTFQIPSKSGTTVVASLNGIVGIYFDDYISKLYVTEFTGNKLSIWSSGQTLPLSGTRTGCNGTGGWFGEPYGVVGDTQGNIYVSHNTCNSVVKWTPNSTIPIRIGGTGISGATSLQLSSPRHIYVDDTNSFIYVADTSNHRVQRFAINGNGTGITVAGGNGMGKGTTQLNSPAGVYVSWKDGSIYVSDRANNRIQKWATNATFGVTVAGYSNGTAGAGPVALNAPYAVTLDRNETWMYIADYSNNRVQRFPVV
jgi:sugar lactone lactonase YvrE